MTLPNTFGPQKNIVVLAVVRDVVPPSLDVLPRLAPTNNQQQSMITARLLRRVRVRIKTKKQCGSESHSPWLCLTGRGRRPSERSRGNPGGRQGSTPGGACVAVGVLGLRDDRPSSPVLWGYGLACSPNDPLCPQLASGKINFDVLLATPDMLPALKKFGRDLGPRMPSLKRGASWPPLASPLPSRHCVASHARVRPVAQSMSM